MHISSAIHPVCACVCLSLSLHLQSVENCACILHNLTYQLETESPDCFSKFSPPPSPGAPSATDSSTVGCFSPKSSKLKEVSEHGL